MFTETLAARLLQAFNRPYLDGSLIPFQELGNPRFIRAIGAWIAQCARDPFKGKWLLAYVLVYAAVFLLLYLARGGRHIQWKILVLVILFNLAIITPFEGFAVRNGYWGYPDVIWLYLKDIPLLGSWPPFHFLVGGVPLSNPLFVYPIAYIGVVWMLGAFLNFSWKNAHFRGLRFPREKLRFDRATWKALAGDAPLWFHLILLSLLLALFAGDVAGFRSRIGYAAILCHMTCLWLAMRRVERVLRRRYYGFQEGAYGRAFLRANLLTIGLATVVESVGLYVFLVWIIYPPKTLLHELAARTHWAVFQRLYDAFGLSAPEEFYYYAICALLGVTSYNFFHLLLEKKDMLHDWNH